MKKIIFILIAVFMLLLPITLINVKADETIPDADTTTSDTTEPADPVEPAEPAENTEPTLDEFKAEVSAWLSQYMEESYVVKIISWLVDAGVLSALFVVWVKYRKHKDTTLEDLINMVKAEVGKYLKESFDKLSVEDLQKVTDSLDKLEKSNETLMKALLLTQDKTIDGRIALVEFLTGKTAETEPDKQEQEKIKEKLEEEKATEEEVKEKVANEYNTIF